MFDPCPHNPDFDGLSIDWHNRNYVNPPYNDALKWFIKGVEEREKGNMSVFLLPARTDTKLFHEHVMVQANYIWFIKGRLRFIGAPAGAPFPSMIVGLIPHVPVGPYFRTLARDKKKGWELI